MPKRKKSFNWFKQKKKVNTSTFPGGTTDTGPTALPSTSGYDWSVCDDDSANSHFLQPRPPQQKGCGCHKEMNPRFFKGNSKHKRCTCNRPATESDVTRGFLRKQDRESERHPTMTPEKDCQLRSTSQEVQESIATDVGTVPSLTHATEDAEMLQLSQEIQDIQIQEAPLSELPDLQVQVASSQSQAQNATNTASCTINETEVVAVKPFYGGPMTKRCQYCDAKLFLHEKSNCCHNGKVSLPDLSPYPQELHELLTGNSSKSRNFQENIRRYNSGMAFASMGASIAIPKGTGPYVYRIHGQIYHQSGCLHPPDGQRRQYGQLYILEGKEATETRMANDVNLPCREDIFQELHMIMQSVSPYAAAYKHMHEVELQNPSEEVKMYIKRAVDQRRYNEPRHDEVAAVFVGKDGAPPVDVDIAVHPRNQPLQQIKTMSSNLDPMIYPLLFPRGDLGWSPDMKHTEERKTEKRNRTTMLQFYSYRLAVRDAFSAIHKSKKLFQQYLVDAYCKHEANQLSFCRLNQRRLRVDLYRGLEDYVNNQAAEQGLHPGRIVVLPSSHQGSPRAMQQNYQDAMSIVAKYGRPDLFLTYTCNPRIPEITENLDGERPENRPDIVARVYKLHLEKLIRDITDHHVLGVPVCHLRVIEFQKRGLPHCHMLITLRHEDKLRDAEDIDRLISAEIPDPAKDPELHKIVTTSMIHGPCGSLNPHSVCMDGGKCNILLVKFRVRPGGPLARRLSPPNTGIV